MSARVLVTGPTGCIGSSAVRWLLDDAAANDPDREVVGFSRKASFDRLGEAAAAMRHVEGDLSERDRVHRVVQDVSPTHVIHLAAAQTPYCNENPLDGMAINLEGTAHLVHALASIAPQLQRVVFASSAAVYGGRDLYPGPTVKPEDELRPVNHYGRWKLAGEAMIRAFHEETGVACCSLRLATTYGPGRDLGLTSAPTRALKSLAAGQAYELPYRGRECYHWVGDMGAAFGVAAVRPFEGHAAFNLPGTTIPSDEFLDRAKDAARDLGLATEAVQFAADAAPATFVCDLDHDSFKAAFPDAPHTDLDEGLRTSIEAFRAMHEAGSLD